jgi:ElaB/YqjD/DUF883 family membrane-anchored ribosome-binding protein
MESTCNQIAERADQARELYQSGRQAVEQLARTATDKSRYALVATDHWVHQNPWMALGIMAGVGLLSGLLISQSSRSRWD